MGAGRSAREEAERQSRVAAQLRYAAAEAAQRSRNYLKASLSEEGIAAAVRPLAELGWVVLEDRRWPGSRRANVDFVLVGRGGVVVVDAKDWSEVRVTDGGLFRGEACEDEAIDNTLALLDTIRDGLADTGLTPASMTAAFAFTGRTLVAHVRGVTIVGGATLATWLTALPYRLTDDQIPVVAEAVARVCPEMSGGPQPSGVPTSRPRHRGEPVPEALFDVEELTAHLVEAALAGPIEDWMTFVDPEQHRLIRSHSNGPSRIRGPAGTGKTVLGLHRALYLAERSPTPLLFVSFVKTLPQVLAQLAHRISPTAAANIEFTGLHRLAHQIATEAGQELHIDPPRVDTAFALAWARHGQRSRLVELVRNPAYWKEEIDHVIKGRGLTEYADYAALKRVGRQSAMRPEHREVMWDLYVDYQTRLDFARVNDFNDLLLGARRALEQGTAARAVGGVIVDEVQDLNLAGLELLSTLAGEGANRLLLIGDGQQSVYPGGFSLAEAGINVVGRSTVLKRNYRNTVEIIEAAARLVEADEFGDLDDDQVTGRREVEVSRHGVAPITVYADDRPSLAAALVSHLHRVRDDLGVPLGDMAVLLPTRHLLDRYCAVLQAAHVPWVELADYDGVTTDRVKIGTFKRAKGLDFKHVFLPEMPDSDPPLRPDESTDVHRERCQLARRGLFVAMTRARDGLWLGYVGSAAR
jgi:AAA domain/UvrD-like helicase C-terminal domain/Nuclease-related domain